MTELELMLAAAGADIQWPATPDMAPAVSARIAAEAPAAPAARTAAEAPAARRARARLGRRSPAGPGARWRISRRSLAVAFAVLLLMAATAAAIPGIRDPVLDFLGLRSVKIERVPRPLPAPAGARLDLGRRTTLAAARPRLAFTPLLPSGLGQPVVWYASFPPGGQLGLVYRGGHLFVTEVDGKLVSQYLVKFVGPDSKIDHVRVNGERGVWIHGRPHQYAFTDRTGNVHTDSIRLAGNVLLWRRGDLLLRMEGARSKAEALRLARSARAAP